MLLLLVSSLMLCPYSVLIAGSTNSSTHELPRQRFSPKTQLSAKREFVYTKSLDPKLERGRRESKPAGCPVGTGNTAVRNSQRRYDRFALLITQVLANVSFGSHDPEGITFDM